MHKERSEEVATADLLLLQRKQHQYVINDGVCDRQ
jgi:hypothetical protein